jgi:SAM-dependent methyltransferase
MCEDASMDVARRAAKEQWTRNPVGTPSVQATDGTPEFFSTLTRTRYEIQPWQPALLDEFAAFLMSYADGGWLLEIGCGPGTDHEYLARLGPNCVAIDLAYRGAWLTKRRLELAGITPRVLVADGEHLPFRSSTFDATYSFGVIHHTDRPERVALEMGRVVRQSGRILVALYYRWSLIAAIMYRRWRRQGQTESWPEYLSRVEEGAAELEERPLVRLYSRRSARALFYSFNSVHTLVTHVGVGERRLPRMREMAGRYFGWFVIVSGRN